MFIGDEFQAAVSAATATARMAELASSSALALMSHAAWRAGTAMAAAPASRLPELAAVHARGPARRGPVSLLILRWEAACLGGLLFPVLDADITLVPDGERATLIGLEGVFRTAPGDGLDPGASRQAATAIIRCLLSRIAATISDPALGDTGADRAWPGGPTLAAS